MRVTVGVHGAVGRPWRGGGGWRERWRAAWAWLALVTTDSGGQRREMAREMTGDAARAPEREAFERFFRAHEREVFSYLWRMTGEEQAAYDLSQETFLRAWQHFARVRTYERPLGWLLRVATNLALTYLKRRKAPVGAATPLPAEGGPSASDPAWRLAERESVARILAALPARQRAALVLFDIYGLSSEELASTLGTSLAAAKMVLARARAQFREHYRREEGQA